MTSEIIVFIFVYVIITPLGIIFLNLIFRDSLKGLPFFQVLGLSLIFGLAIYVIILSSLGYFLISLELLFGIAASSWLILLVMTKRKKINYGNFNIFLNIISLIVLVLPIIYCGYYLVDTPWHNADDARKYGLATSSIKYYGKYTMTYLPYANIPSTWEIGVPVIAAYISYIGDIQNGKAIMVSGALAISLIPCILYSIVFSLIKKSYLSLFASMSVFNVYNVPYGMSIWSRFFSGNYGNVYGLFFLFLYVWLLTKYVFLKNKNIWYYLILNIFILIASYYVYQGYILHMFLFTCILYISNIVKADKNMLENFISLIVIIIPFIILTLIIIRPNLFSKKVIYLLWPIIGRFSSVRITQLPISIENPNYGLNLSYFSQNIEGILVLPLMIIAISTIIYKKQSRNLFTYFYIYVSFIVVFYALSGMTTNLYFAPKRTAIAVNHMTWLVLVLMIYHYYFDNFTLSKIKMNHNTITMFVKKEEVRNMFILFLCMLCITFFLIPHITYVYPTKKTWYVHTLDFNPNFNAANWLNDHASLSDYILNDMSYTGYMLLSMSVFNLTYADPITHFPGYHERGKDLWQVWTNPNDEALIRNLLFKYNVTYIISDSDWRLLALPNILNSTERGWSEKPFIPSVIVNIFDNYSFLDKVFEYDTARVYKVLKDKLECIEIYHTVVNDRQNDFWNASSWGTGTIGEPILSSDTENVNNGLDSLKIEIPSGMNNRVGIRHSFYEVQDWSNYKLISLNIFGGNTNQVITLLITDSSGKAQAIALRDNFKGWKQIDIPLNPDQEWSDWKRPGFPNLSDVLTIEFRFTPMAGDILYLDNIELKGIIELG